MTKYYLYISIFFIMLFFSGCVKEIRNNDTSKKKSEIALVVHGGAGYIYEGRYSKEEEEKYVKKLE